MSISNTMQYKGYYGSVNYSSEDDVLHGKILGIKSLVSYEGNSVQELKNDFELAVDDYLEMCKDEGIEPEQPCKEAVSVKLDPETQIKAAILAQSENITLNELVELSLREKLRDVG